MAKMKQYPTSIQHDEVLLKTEGLTKRHRMAVEVRLGEKFLLQEAIALVERSTNGNEKDGRVAKKARTKA